MNRNLIERYKAADRINHWFVALTFILLALSGLALFHPALFWLSHLFGGGPWTRILHPFLGVAMFVFFLGLVLRFWRANFITANDRLWLRRIDRVMLNREDGVPPIGKYNANIATPRNGCRMRVHTPPPNRLDNQNSAGWNSASPDSPAMRNRIATSQ